MVSKRTLINELASSDVEEVLEMYQEKDTFKYIKPLLEKDEGFYREFLNKKIAFNQNQVEFWVVRNRVNNEFIGTINLNRVPNTSYIQIGCHLKRKFWKSGYATELMSTLLIEAFEKRGMSEVYGVFEQTNRVSKKLLKNLGFHTHVVRDLSNSVVHIQRLTLKKWING